MKSLYKDANFPRTEDSRVYHLGLRPGEVANRIVTVGAPSRAESIASHFDPSPPVFVLRSERGFLTITGRYKHVPMSVVSIGMGGPNMDFFVREVRESVRGDMVVVRLGSCGALIDVPVGSVAVPKASVAVTRNLDYDFGGDPRRASPYRISKPVEADPVLHNQVLKALQTGRPEGADHQILGGIVNASADSFYSSQGRQTSFPDHNTTLVEHMINSVRDLGVLEMETFYLLHLAACWRGRAHVSKAVASEPVPLTTTPVSPERTSPEEHPPMNAAQQPLSDATASAIAAGEGTIRAAAAQIVFANRTTTSQDFIAPDQVCKLEEWTGKAILDALCDAHIATDRLHPEAGSVWELV